MLVNLSSWICLEALTVLGVSILKWWRHVLGVVQLSWVYNARPLKYHLLWKRKGGGHLSAPTFVIRYKRCTCIMRIQHNVEVSVCLQQLRQKKAFYLVLGCLVSWSRPNGLLVSVTRSYRGQIKVEGVYFIVLQEAEVVGFVFQKGKLQSL